MKIRELVESKYDYSLADYEATPYDQGFEWVATNRHGPKEPHIGPQEGKYLNLMLKKIKPAVVLSDEDEKKLFEPYIKDGTFKVTATTNHNWYVTLPGEEWRGPKLKKLFNQLYKIQDQNLTYNKSEKIIHAKIGRLLGLPKESVRYFLDNLS